MKILYSLLAIVSLFVIGIIVLVHHVENINLPIDSSVEVSLLMDKIHLHKNRAGYVFDEIPEILFPTNTLINVYQKDFECDHIYFLFFSFFIPSGKVEFLDNSVCPSIRDHFSPRMMDVINRTSNVYYGSMKNLPCRRIPAIRMENILSFSNESFFYTEKCLEITVIETTDGTYVCGQRKIEM